MYLMKQVYNSCEQVDEMSIYIFQDDKWHFEKMIKVKGCKALIDFIASRADLLDYAILKLNQPYRNVLYHFNPHIKIAIDKEEIVTLFYSLIAEDKGAYEEAAAALEDSCSCMSINSNKHHFIDDFYRMCSRTEAVHFYELWQLHMPLNDKKASQFIRTMEFYLDEVINYFTVKPICDFLNR